MTQHIIRRIRLAHCKRGPLRCAQCREMDVEQICLLELFAPGESLAQRRVTEVEIDGKPAWREFEVAQVFASAQEAEDYAAQHGIEDIELAAGGEP